MLYQTPKKSNAFRLFNLLLLLMVAVTCAGQESGSVPDCDTTSIYIVRLDWHAEIAFPRDDIPKAVWPEISAFPRAEYIQIGWGDSAYFQTRDPGFLLTLKAGMLPTPSVLHVTGFSGSLTVLFHQSRLVRLPVNDRQLQILAKYIRDAYARNPEGQIIMAGDGLFRNSHFYKGAESYIALRNCNTWVAYALKKAGFTINPRCTLTVGTLMGQVRQFGNPVE